jgi:3',5'-cyclic AMP phosphodiesterase CpdA
VQAWTRYALVRSFWLYVMPSLFLWILAFHWLGITASAAAVLNGVWRGPALPRQSYALLGLALAAIFDAWTFKTCVLDMVLAGKLESVFHRWEELLWRAVPVALSLGLASLFAALSAGASCLGWMSGFLFAFTFSSAMTAFFLTALFLWDLALKGIFRVGTGRPKIQLSRLDFTKPRPDFTPRLRVAHLADLHLTVDPGTPAVSGQGGGNLAFDRLMRTHVGALKAVDSIFICGDIADAGRAREWDVFFKGYPQELLKKSIMVPGNHDVNIIDPADRLAQDPDLVLRRKRLIRTMAAMDLVQGERAWVLDERLQRVRLRDYLASFQKDFTDYIENPPKPVYDTGALAWLETLVGAQRFDIHSLENEERMGLPARVWEAIFPMAIELPSGKAVALVLDSNAAAGSLLDNALGTVSPAALHRLHHFQELYRGQAQVVLLHHHVALPPLNFGFFGNLQADLMTLLNADDLLDTLAEKKGSLIFHGHKHLSYMAELDGEFQSFSAPSSTLGDELEPERAKGFYTFELAFSKDGRAAVVKEPEFFSI